MPSSPHSLTVAGKSYGSRLLIGTGKYKDFAEPKRRSKPAAHRSSPWPSVAPTSDKTPASRTCSTCHPAVEIHLLPNTAGCYTADDAVRTLRLARELLDGHDAGASWKCWATRRLCPEHVVETIAAAKTLVRDGFKVMVYTSDDPIIAKKLEDIGCVAVMPLASLIGSGMGILNPWNLQIIIDNAQRCRWWSMPVSARPRMPRLPWNWAVTPC
jgi:thiazole synthase